MIRRRKSAIAARAAFAASPWGRLIDSQAAMAAITPRVGRVVELLDLAPGKRYVDIGCGTAAFAHLVAARAGMDEAPVTLDITPGPGPLDAVAWPEKLPLRDGSVDALTCFYFVRRFDDDVLHNFGRELSRVLAPGGAGLVLEVAPVKSERLERWHRKLLSPGTAEVDLRGWGRLAASFTECGFDAIDLVNLGPFVLPPIPRVGVLLQRSPANLSPHIPEACDGHGGCGEGGDCDHGHGSNGRD
ncbi:MAG: methyltransferase domain-containing protein [Dehalococcoidia bacterium]|nr:methyltransferase domain-containing protein [Dehalococcoidia bacterium]